MSSGKLAGGGAGVVLIILLLSILLGPGCTQLGLNTASRSLYEPAYSLAPVLGQFNDHAAVESADDWVQRRRMLQSAFEDHVYGPYPQGVSGELQSRDILEEDFLGLGRLEELTVRLGEGNDAIRFRIALAVPHGAGPDLPAPLILAENFCGNRLAMDRQAISPPLGEAGGCGNNPLIKAVVKIILGEHIATPPLSDILERGYAIAEIYPAEIAPDNEKHALPALQRLGLLTGPEHEPHGVIAVWAATYGWAIDAISDDPRIAQDKIIAWGHSRHAKAALLAGAYESRIAGVISHQSGTGGATPNVSPNGESIGRITRSYPHWFAPIYAGYEGREAELPVDQHHLIALNAPKPVFLGNGWKDVWSDPNGVFRASMAADAAYEFAGLEGLSQSGLADPDYLSGEIAFQIRSGGHGVRRADWRAFLDWLDQWFPSPLKMDR